LLISSASVVRQSCAGGNLILRFALGAVAMRIKNDDAAHFVNAHLFTRYSR
jgi:hypothetical protein